ncbi:MAG: GlxA family transcriptional regulator [Pseudomonadota bacterium]
MQNLNEIFPPAPEALNIEPDLTVTFLLTQQFSLLPFSGFIDILRLSADEADYSRQIYCRWQFAATTLKPIRTSCGIEVTPDVALADASPTDYLVVVGGRLPWTVEEPEETLQHLRTAYDRGTTVIGLCTGVFLVARAGLLAGKTCAVNFLHLKQMQALFPDIKPITDRNYVIDEGVITCNGGTSSIDLACAIVESKSGKARATKALTTMVVDSRRTAHHMPHHPYEYLVACGNRLVEQAVSLMQQNISNPLSISALASKLNISERELGRVFKKYSASSPGELYRDMRLAHGRWLLTNTTRSIGQISYECGFSDSSHFSRWFKATYDESPGQFRSWRQQVNDA